MQKYTEVWLTYLLCRYCRTFQLYCTPSISCIFHSLHYRPSCYSCTENKKASLYLKFSKLIKNREKDFVRYFWFILFCVLLAQNRLISGGTSFTSFCAFLLDLHSSGWQVVRYYRFSGVKHIASFVAFGGGVIVLVLGVS